MMAPLWCMHRKCLSQAAKEGRLDRRKHDVEPVELVLQQVATLGESWL